MLSLDIYISIVIDQFWQWMRLHSWYWYQSFMDASNFCGVDRTKPRGPEMDHLPLDRIYLVVVLSYDMSCALILWLGSMDEIPWLILILNLHRWVQFMGCTLKRPLGSRNGPSAIGPQLFGSSAVVWYVMCIDFLNGIQWVKFHGRYWYQSFMDEFLWLILILILINGSNIQGRDRTDPWGPEMYHPPLGRSYLVVVPSYDMSCALIFLPGSYGLDFMAGIDINPSSMGQIFEVWIAPTLGVPKWTIRHLTAAIW